MAVINPSHRQAILNKAKQPSSGGLDFTDDFDSLLGDLTSAIAELDSITAVCVCFVLFLIIVLFSHFSISFFLFLSFSFSLGGVGLSLLLTQLIHYCLIAPELVYVFTPFFIFC